MYIIFMSHHILRSSFILPSFSLADIKACLNGFTDHSPCKLKSLPLLPQNGCRDKSQTFPSDRVQEITVYISSCITLVSKLSGFGSAGGRGGGGYCASNTIWAGAYHCWLLWCRHWGGSCLYHLCFAQAQLFLLTRLTSYLLMLRIFDVCWEGMHRRESLWHWWPQNLPPISLLEFKFKQLKRIVFVPLFLFLWLQGICSLLSSPASQWKLRRIFKWDVLWLTISSWQGQLSIKLLLLCIIRFNQKSYIRNKCKFTPKQSLK